MTTPANPNPEFLYNSIHPITYYIVERSSPVPHKKIYSIVVAGPFDNEAEAINERVQNYRDIGSLNLWYDVWTDTQLREAGLLP